MRGSTVTIIVIPQPPHAPQRDAALHSEHEQLQPDLSGGRQSRRHHGWGGRAKRGAGQQRLRPRGRGLPGWLWPVPPAALSRNWGWGGVCYIDHFVSVCLVIYSLFIVLYNRFVYADIMRSHHNYTVTSNGQKNRLMISMRFQYLTCKHFTPPGGPHVVFPRQRCKQINSKLHSSQFHEWK